MLVALLELRALALAAMAELLFLVQLHRLVVVEAETFFRHQVLVAPVVLVAGVVLGQLIHREARPLLLGRATLAA
jgi:hypothetical protein